MDEICSLNIHLWYVGIPQKVLLKSLHAQRRSFFFTEFAIWCKNPPFYEVKKYPKKALGMEEFQNIFF